MNLINWEREFEKRKTLSLIIKPNKHKIRRRNNWNERAKWLPGMSVMSVYVSLSMRLEDSSACKGSKKGFVLLRTVKN
jgi:hypothetical protein